MAIDSVVELFQPIPGRASDGTLMPTWEYSGFGGGNWHDTDIWADAEIWYDGANDIIITDVQPKNLTDAQLQIWGLDVTTQDAKAVYDFSFSPYWQIANRARVDGDRLYRILAVNPWSTHYECVIIPQVGA